MKNICFPAMAHRNVVPVQQAARGRTVADREARLLCGLQPPPECCATHAGSCKCNWLLMHTQPWRDAGMRQFQEATLLQAGGVPDIPAMRPWR